MNPGSAATRDTRQKRAIRAAFESAGGPLSTEEVRDAAARQIPRLGLATVYRTIRAMLDDGTLAPVELPGEPARYEPSGRAHHHHFRCSRCERVFELDECKLSDLRLPAGFRAHEHAVTVYGHCGDCAAG